MIPPKVDQEEVIAFLDNILGEESPEALRGTIMEMVLAVGFWYRRTQIHKFLHPFFFLAGFITCYFFIS